MVPLSAEERQLQENTAKHAELWREIEAARRSVGSEKPRFAYAFDVRRRMPRRWVGFDHMIDGITAATESIEQRFSCRFSERLRLLLVGRVWEFCAGDASQHEYAARIAEIKKRAWELYTTLRSEDSEEITDLWMYYNFDAATDCLQELLDTLEKLTSPRVLIKKRGRQSEHRRARIIQDLADICRLAGLRITSSRKASGEIAGGFVQLLRGIHRVLPPTTKAQCSEETFARLAVGIKQRLPIK